MAWKHAMKNLISDYPYPSPYNNKYSQNWHQNPSITLKEWSCYVPFYSFSRKHSLDRRSFFIYRKNDALLFCKRHIYMICIEWEHRWLDSIHILTTTAVSSLGNDTRSEIGSVLPGNTALSFVLSIPAPISYKSKRCFVTSPVVTSTSDTVIPLNALL